MLALYHEWLQTPMTDDERAILDDFDRFQQEHPFKIRQLQDEE